MRPVLQYPEFEFPCEEECSLYNFDNTWAPYACKERVMNDFMDWQGHFTLGYINGFFTVHDLQGICIAVVCVVETSGYVFTWIDEENSRITAEPEAEFKRRLYDFLRVKVDFEYEEESKYEEDSVFEIEPI